MRDVMNVNGSAKVMIDFDGAYTNYTYKSLYRERGDAVNTLPVKGQYVKPTNYSGREFRSSAIDFNCICKGGGNVSHRFYGQSTIGYYSTELSSMYGLTGSDGKPDFPLSAFSRLDFKLRSKCMKSEWNLGQTLAEAGETLNFIASALKTVFELYKAIKHGNVNMLKSIIRSIFARDRLEGDSIRRQLKAHLRKHDVRPHMRDVLGSDLYPLLFTKGSKLRSFVYHSTPSQMRKQLGKGVADAYLAYQFVVLPLMNDIYQACALISDGITTPGVFVAHGEVKVEPLKAPTPNEALNVNKDFGFLQRRVLKGEVHYSLLSPSLYKLDVLGLLNPLSIAWQLLPLSFVVDWFLSIGKFVAAISQPLSLAFQDGYRTSYQKWSIDKEFLPVTATAWGSGVMPKAQAVSRSFKRELYVTFPIPTPYFRGFGNLSIGKWISAIALTVQRAT